MTGFKRMHPGEHNAFPGRKALVYLDAVWATPACADFPERDSVVRRDNPHKVLSVLAKNRRRRQKDGRSDWFGERYGHICAEPESRRRIIEGELDPARQGRCVGLRRDFPHFAGCCYLGIDKQRDSEFGAFANLRHEIVGDIEDGFADIGTRDGDNRLTCRDDLADFDIPYRNNAVVIRVKFGVTGLLLGLRETRAGLRKPGFGGFQRGDRGIELCLRCAPAAGRNESAFTLFISLCVHHEGFGVGQIGFRGEDCELSQTWIESCKPLAFFHEVADGCVAGNDPATRAKPELSLITGLDSARERAENP